MYIHKLHSRYCWICVGQGYAYCYNNAPFPPAEISFHAVHACACELARGCNKTFSKLLLHQLGKAAVSWAKFISHFWVNFSSIKSQWFQMNIQVSLFRITASKSIQILLTWYCLYPSMFHAGGAAYYLKAVHIPRENIKYTRLLSTLK